jgi:hypothetical protein
MILRMEAKIEDKTLTMLTTLCDLLDLKHNPKHIAEMWERAARQVDQYRQTQKPN